MLCVRLVSCSQVSPQQDAHAVFSIYEGFEGDLSAFTVAPGCGGDVADVHAEASPMLPYAGSKSLYLGAGRTTLTHTLATPMTAYRLRAWLWDSGAAIAASFISPDYPDCSTEGSLDVTPASTSAGVFSPADGTVYCTGQPWDATDVPRTNAWHLVEIASDGSTATVSIDGQTVKTVDDGAPLTKLFIASGFSGRPRPFPGLDVAHSVWDEISVLAPSGVTAGALGATSPALLASLRWRQVAVPPGAPQPAPRYSHTTVEHGGKLWVFGGERSAYSFNDLWALDLATETWTSVELNSLVTPPPRFDHSAVVMEVAGESVLVVYGGRSGHVFLGDLWVFSFATSTWRQLAPSGALEPGLRFAHAAAVASNNQMYLFGGYTEGGFSAELFACELTATAASCRALSLGCAGAPVSNAVPAALAPRYSHSLLAHGEFLFVYGGSNLDSVQAFAPVFKYATEQCFWEQLPSQAGSDAVGRYEHAAVVMGDWLLVQGGHDTGGTPSASMFAYPL